MGEVGMMGSDVSSCQEFAARHRLRFGSASPTQFDAKCTLQTNNMQQAKSRSLPLVSIKSFRLANSDALEPIKSKEGRLVTHREKAMNCLV